MKVKPMGVKVKLTVYRDVLVIETLDPDKEYPGWVPIGPGKVGCVLIDTRKSLGVSNEALAWLRDVKRSHDDIGDVDWSACSDGTKAFSWLGGVYSLKLRGTEGSNSYAVFEKDCVKIPNHTSIDAQQAVDRALAALAKKV